MTAVRTRVDPITAAVIHGALDSIAVEMGHKLARMAYSSIIRESEDFGCVLCDAEDRHLELIAAPEERRFIFPDGRVHPWLRTHNVGQRRPDPELHNALLDRAAAVQPVLRAGAVASHHGQTSRATL